MLEEEVNNIKLELIIFNPLLFNNHLQIALILKALFEQAVLGILLKTTTLDDYNLCIVDYSFII